MSKKFSSFDQQQLIMESFRKFINEGDDWDDDRYDQDDEDYMQNQADYRGKDLSVGFDFGKYAPKQMTYEEYGEKIEDFARELHNSEKRDDDETFEKVKSSIRSKLGKILQNLQKNPKDKDLFIDVVELAKEELGPYLNPKQK
jgi:hypothetical protein